VIEYLPWSRQADEETIMARTTYVPEDFGREIEAPSGYYQPVAEEWLDHDGKRLLYVLGTACIEASCCGVGSWNYLRVEGYLTDDVPPRDPSGPKQLEIDTIDRQAEREAIATILGDRYPGVRIEFR
jgi:hypothetical protein